MKGSVRDTGVILLVFAILVMVTMTEAVFYNNFKTAIQTSGIDQFNATAPIFQRADNVINSMVNMPAMLILLMGISAIVLAFFIPSHPIFLPLSFIFWIMYVFLAVAFANLLWMFINISLISPTANNFPLIVWLIQYLPHVIAIFGAIIMIVMYSKRPIQ
jgi:hypothetical protein